MKNPLQTYISLHMSVCVCEKHHIWSITIESGMFNIGKFPIKYTITMKIDYT